MLDYPLKASNRPQRVPNIESEQPCTGGHILTVIPERVEPVKALLGIVNRHHSGAGDEHSYQHQQLSLSV